MNITARMDKIIPAETGTLLRALGALASQNDYAIYLVGGMVRDILLGRENLDIDIAVDGDGQAFAELVAETMNGSIVMHGRFGTSVVILPDKTRIDIATARQETYSRPGALPDVAYAPIEFDLQRRDFSINAMAVSLNSPNFGLLKDYYGGRKDLGAGVVRSLYPESFIDDPTRILRAARFAAVLRFNLDNATEKRCRQAVTDGYLIKVSAARLRKEIFAIAEGPNAPDALRWLGKLGVWDALAPGLKPDNTAFRAIDQLSAAETALSGKLKPVYKRRFAVLSALLIDSGPDAAAALCGIIDISRFRASGIVDFAARADYIADKIAKTEMTSSLYALLSDYSEESLAVLWSAGDKAVRQGIERFLVSRMTKPLITGRDLIRWGYPPSEAFSGVLRMMFMRQLDGEIKTKDAVKAALEKDTFGNHQLDI